MNIYVFRIICSCLDSIIIVSWHVFVSELNVIVTATQTQPIIENNHVDSCCLYFVLVLILLTFW
jgi:hypothetical protein